MIGSSDGKQYESEFDLALGRPVQPPEKPAGASKVDPGMVRPPGTLPGMKPYPEQPGNPMHDREALPINIDREHHVPLVASALTDDKGEMYGMAIDHRIPPKPEYEKHLINHEAYENDYMNDLVKNGMSSQDAYHKAHDWSTARESAAVTAEFGEKGLEDYKQHWRDAASIAAEPTDRPRHPDAHTTKHGLDESELGKSFKMAANADRGDPTKKPELSQMSGGGFAPKAPPESIHSAAIRTKDGEVHIGVNHSEAYMNALEAGKLKPSDSLHDEDQGFMTNTGRFVSRHEALDIADKAKQIPSIDHTDKYTQKYWKSLGLISEDLKQTLNTFRQ